MQKEMEERIEQSKAVEEISLLTDEILDITERTKLLALNASIEAARAGESGKGFAVVAEEIGKLAQNSAVAAEQISHVSGNVVHAVNGLSGKATEMITFMDEVTMQGYDRLLETSDYYSNYIEQLNTMMTDFSTASNQLRETIRLVSTSVDSLNAAVEVNVSDITDVASVALTMSDDMAQMKTDATCNKDISLKLNNEVDKFKL
jgi:methyl-accepting chemotaxis protein